MAALRSRILPRWRPTGLPRPGGGLTGSPTQSRIARTFGAVVMKAMIRTSAPECGQVSGRISEMRTSNMAHAECVGECGGLAGGGFAVGGSPGGRWLDSGWPDSGSLSDHGDTLPFTPIFSCLRSFFCEGGRPRLPGRSVRPSHFSSSPNASPINGRPMV
jgi:hypothetical protein